MDGFVIFLIFFGIVGSIIYKAYQENEKKKKEEASKQSAPTRSTPSSINNGRGEYMDLAEEIRRQKQKEQAALNAKTPLSKQTAHSNNVREKGNANNSTSTAMKSTMYKTYDSVLTGNLKEYNDQDKHSHPYHSRKDIEFQPVYTENSMGEIRSQGCEEHYYQRAVVKKASTVFDNDNDNLSIARMMIMGEVLSKPKFKK